MKELYRRFYTSMNQFRRLRLGSLFPDMTKGDCMALMAIAHYNSEEKDGVLTVSELADKLHAKPSAVSRTLKGLEDRGLIERTINKSDRRNTYVELSESGMETRKRIESTMSGFAEAVLSRMNETDLERLIVYLNELYQVAEEELTACQRECGKE